MKETALSSTKNKSLRVGLKEAIEHGHAAPSPPESTLDVESLKRHAVGWFHDQTARRHAQTTLDLRTLIVENLLWWLHERGHLRCGVNELREFFVYLGDPDGNKTGRWGNPRLTSAVKTGTAYTYHNHLRTFFRWLISEDVLKASPMERIATPKRSRDQIAPFSADDIEALEKAARKSKHPECDRAIVILLHDSGLRASELCSLRRHQLNLDEGRLSVVGKGNKERQIRFGTTARKALVAYINRERHQPEAPMFLADRGTLAGEGLTRSGLRQLIERLGISAGIQGKRCSPHTFRHTFALDFLNNGGNVMSLKELLGHDDLTMTNRYVNFSQADIGRQHQMFSPADHLHRGAGNRERRFRLHEG